MTKIHLSVIIPAYNEEKFIGNALLAIDNYLSLQNFFYEIIVVSDGSRDKTIKIVKYNKVVKNLRLIISEPNYGKGYAVKLGMLESKGKYRLFMDADNSTSIEHIEKMWPYFKRGYQIVIGSRDKKDAVGAMQAVHQPFLKRLLGNLGNFLIQLLILPGIWDTQCGFKAFTAEVAQNIFPRCQINRWGFDIEVLALARRLKYKIAIIPVYWINCPYSKVSLQGYLYTIWEIFTIKYNLLMDKYNYKKQKR